MAKINVNVLNYWKSKLKDMIGFDVCYQGFVETLGQEIFNCNKKL